MMLDTTYILTHTAADIAAHFSAQEIAATYYMDEDELVECIGSSDPADWADKTGTEMIDDAERTLVEWYDLNGTERPSYTAEDLGLSLVLYSAWQIAATNEEE